jgi:tyrosyl-DNA phosphodiesterase-1
LVNDKPVAGDQTLDTTRPAGPPRLIPSPVQLTHIVDYPASKGYNVDAVKLRDILGDPMIRECWQFNYMFDVDFLMNQFDEDVRRLVNVKVVHGSWKKESPNRIMIDVSLHSPEITRGRNIDMFQETCSRHPNVEPIIAYMPDPFGTHHSKMMILLRHDDLAQ